MDESKSYHLVSKIIHWITAILILWLLYLGYTMSVMDYSASKFEAYALHKSLGLTVLALAFVRVIWHLLYKKPKALPTHAWWEKFMAHAAHIFLYVTLFVLPLSGWIMSSAGDFTVKFWGIDVPDIVEKNEELFSVSRNTHGLFALLVCGVVSLHIVGAIKHHFIDRDQTLQRMISKNMGLKEGAALTVFLSFAAAGILFAFVTLKTKERSMQEPAIVETVSQEPQLNDPENASLIDQISLITSWHILKDQSAIGFEATQYGQSFEGFFDFDGEIVFEPQKLGESSVRVEIYISSIQTGSDDRDVQAKSDDWFNVASFPNAVFEATTFEKIEKVYIAHGFLTIHGVRKEIDLPFTLGISKNEKGVETAKMNAEIILNRLDFEVGQGQWKSVDVIGADVKISIILMANAQ